MLLCKVKGRKYFGRTADGQVKELPIGTNIVLNGDELPAALTGKLEVLRPAKEGEFVVNDTPTAARLREEGKTAEADKIMSAAKEKMAEKIAKATAGKAAKAAKDDDGKLPGPKAKE